MDIGTRTVEGAIAGGAIDGGGMIIGGWIMIGGDIVCDEGSTTIGCGEGERDGYRWRYRGEYDLDLRRS